MSSRSFDHIPKPNSYGPSRTKSIPNAEHDINSIMARALKTGQLPQGPTKAPVYADVSQVGDFARVQTLARLLPAAEKYLASEQKKAAAKAAAVKAAQPPPTPAPPVVPPPPGGAS